MLRQSTFILALSSLIGTLPAVAQSGAVPTTAVAGTEAANASCPGTAVFSAGGGPEVHVTRIGTLDQRNPLAPLTDAAVLTVLEVRIRGKLAAAYGPTFQEMRRAGPPQDLERELGNAIRWEPTLASLPQNVRIVAEDSSEVIAKLRFVKCLAPAKRRPAPEQAIKPRPKEAPAPVEKRPPLP